jgi:dTDP-N-acetylfucosamine:lipid II N-acetylfucosaminyltransferase
MIVHLFEDEKFVDSTIDNFENVSKGKNRYIIFSDSILLKHVTRLDQVEIMPNSYKRVNIDLIIKDCKLLIIHYLSPLKLYILKKIPNNITVIWSVWGGDAYSYFSNQDIYEPLTNKFKSSSLKEVLKSTFLYNIYHLYKYRVLSVNNEIAVLKKVDYLFTVLPYEYDSIVKEFNLRAKYLEFNYGVNNFDKKLFPELGGSVLLGNSATYSNNHLDIFELIKGTDKKLIVPLSYGGTKDYNNFVLKEGVKIFNTLFCPIIEFMKLDKYDELILSCNTVIMYHVRQQALGNIYMSLYLGMRVFLNKKSITYKYMNDVGMIVFDLEKDKDLIGFELNKKDKVINRNLVSDLQGKKMISNKIKEIYRLHDIL